LVNPAFLKMAEYEGNSIGSGAISGTKYIHFGPIKPIRHAETP